MAKVFPLSENELQLLASLNRHRVQFMVVGLSAAALQGAPVVTEDVDLWFENLGDPNLRRALMEVGAAYVPPFGLNPPMLAGPCTDPFDVVLSMSGLGKFAEEVRQAKEIRLGRLRLKVLPLERILHSKRTANRPKDRLVVPVLENTIKTLAASGLPKRKPASRPKASADKHRVRRGKP